MGLDFPGDVHVHNLSPVGRDGQPLDMQPTEQVSACCTWYHDAYATRGPQCCWRLERTTPTLPVAPPGASSLVRTNGVVISHNVVVGTVPATHTHMTSACVLPTPAALCVLLGSDNGVLQLVRLPGPAQACTVHVVKPIMVRALRCNLMACHNHAQPAAPTSLVMHPGLHAPVLLACLRDSSLVVVQAPDTQESWVEAAEGGATMLVALLGGHGLACCRDASLGNAQGMGWPQVYAAAGHSVHVLLGSTAVATHSRSSEGGSMPTGMWGAMCAATTPPLSLAVLSFLNGTRVMAVHGAWYTVCTRRLMYDVSSSPGTQLLDVTSDIALDAEATTVAAGLVAPNVLAQVTASGVTLVHLQSSGRGGVPRVAPGTTSGSSSGVSDMPRQLSMTRRSSSSRCGG